MEKLSYKYYEKQITTRDNVDVQSNDQEENELNIIFEKINLNFLKKIFVNFCKVL